MALPQNLKDAKIGLDQRQSETVIPNFLQIKIKQQKITVIDMPGFINSEDCFGGIIHAYFTQLIFSKIRKIKFVLVSHYTDLERTAINFAKAFEQFLVIFANNSQNYARVSLLVNCVPKTVSQQRLLKTIESVKVAKQFQESYRKIVKKLQQNNRLFKFDKAQLNVKISPEMMKIGQRIHDRVSKWWERDMEGRKVNMKVFKIKISYAESSDTGYIRQFDQFSQYLQKMFQKQFIKQYLKRILLQLSEQIDKQTPVSIAQHSQEYYQQRQGTMKEMSAQSRQLCSKYEQKRRDAVEKWFKLEQPYRRQESSNSVPISLHKMKCMKKIHQICNDLYQNCKITLDYLQKNSSDYLKIILTTLLELVQTLSPQSTKQIRQYFFDLYEKQRILSQLYTIYLNTVQSIDLYNKKLKILPKKFSFMILAYRTYNHKLFTFIQLPIWHIFIRYIDQLDVGAIQASWCSEYVGFVEDVCQSLKLMNKDELLQNHIVETEVEGVLYRMKGKISELNKKGNSRSRVKVYGGLLNKY